jgi:ankyrin repeat protein
MRIHRTGLRVTGGSSPALLVAIRDGDLDEVRRLLDAGADASLEIETRIPDGVHRTTPLAAAAQGGHPAIVRLLLERGAHPAGGSSHGVLVGLALEGFYEPEVVRLLVEAGADPNERYQDTAVDILDAVARAGDLETLRFLLARGVALDASHLRAAAESGHPDVFLAVADCPVRRDGERFFASGSGALLRAVLGEGTVRDAQPRLLRQFLGIRDRFPDAEARLESMVAAGALARAEDEPLPPLHVLVNPLANPVGPRAETEDLPLARVLLDAGEPVDAPFPYANSPDAGATPMMRAAGFGRAELVTFFLERGADPRKRDATGRSAAAYADRAASADLAARLVAAGAEAQRWLEVSPPSAPVATAEEPVDLITKIGCSALALGAAVIVFFWLLVRFG